MLVEEEPPPENEENMDIEISKSTNNQFKIESFLCQREIGSVKSVVKTFRPDFQHRPFCQKDVREHTGCINALQFSHNDRFLASGDDMHGRVWNVDELMVRKTPKPIGVMEHPHRSNIFSLEFDLENRFLYSGERWGTVIKHDIETKQSIYVANENNNRGDVYHMDQHPTDNTLIVVTRAKLVSFIDNRDRQNPISLVLPANSGKNFYTAEFHPETPALILVNSETGGPNVFDRRMQARPVYQRSMFKGLPQENTEWMGSLWSPSGNQFMSIRRGKCPLYFDFISQRCFVLKSDHNPNGYCNIKTIKSMTFIDDYTVATGSDHWGIHIWKLPRANDSYGFTQIGHDEEEMPSEIFIEKELTVLRGHRSVPNQVRFSQHNNLLVSSGVENSFKLWSDHRLPWSYDLPFERRPHGTYDLSAEEECLREMEERRVVEDALDLNGEMDGRACWRDIFGGDARTAEDRDTLEMFDPRGHGDDEEDVEESSSEDSDDMMDNEADDNHYFRRRRGPLQLFVLLQRAGEEHLARMLEEHDGVENDLLEELFNMRRRFREESSDEDDSGDDGENGDENDNENDNIESSSSNSDSSDASEVGDLMDFDGDDEEEDEGDDEAAIEEQDSDSEA
ncbi:WD_REPEATS_REGION domain-containing protein [Caenorhabditis elegans]|uniref:WD_REPEATS_REGION domain-containing protein n=1 Tax=Caenorhabditis elegans TaxID=6239 RepID=Q7JLF4_CAEEL|nr:WD_REPEATS_REGION domain-containing protein [Caenorhabditis elegans]CAA99908.2 WD_REPEATS_REGION domain-containing protein [Caenorhabditis elegans]|eukprot:NP_506172.2 Uncharacterized protein CELE_R11D1.1 [Caenorhabditis elegans]